SCAPAPNTPAMTTSRRKPRTADTAVNPVTSAAAWAIPERAFTPSNLMQLEWWHPPRPWRPPKNVVRNDAETGESDGVCGHLLSELYQIFGRVAASAERSSVEWWEGS